MTKPITPVASTADRQITLAKLAGSFVYRFGGPAMRTGNLYHLEGIGQFQLDQQGKLSGNHKYSILALEGTDAAVLTGAYRLQGQLTIQSDGSGDAVIRFTSTEGQGEDLDGQFHVLVAQTVDHIWFVSSGAKLLNGKPAQELARLEAMRIVA